MFSMMGTMAREYMGLEYFLPPLGLYPLKDEVVMGVACVTLRVLLQKGRYVGHPQWDIMMKFPIAWNNLYVDGLLGMGDTIYSRDGENFT